MDYFTLLNLNREPFSNSPDPNFFFQSRQHLDCLQKLELALRLKRGLNVVIGAVGAGKTTLGRKLFKKLADDDSIDTHLILDPSFDAPQIFLETIGTLIAGSSLAGESEHGCKEKIKQHLYEKGVEHNRTVILMIDEGQKLPLFCLEILRELLNYETNDAKLLQIIVFAQEEFRAVLDRHANLADRVNLIHYLGPMSYADTCRMIRFRIGQSSDHPDLPDLFSRPALIGIYRVTGGYPRKIINLCHQCMLALIVQNQRRVGWRLVHSCTQRTLVAGPGSRRQIRPALLTGLTTLVAVIVIATLFSSQWLTVAGNFLNGRRPEYESASPVEARSTRPVVVPAASVSREKPDSHSLETAPEHKEPTMKSVTPGKPPVLLGRVTVAPGDTLGKMITTIYGDFRPSRLEAVMAANPQIRRADDIRVGDTVVFPAVPVALNPPPYPLWWIKIFEATTLDEAFRHAMRRSRNDPARRVISQWDPNMGMQHRVYLSRFFISSQDAEIALAELPAEGGHAAEIVSVWPAEALLYSDPLLGKGR